MAGLDQNMAPRGIQDPAQIAENEKGWGSFFERLKTDETLRNTMFGFAADVAQPLKPGESFGTKILSSISKASQKQTDATRLNAEDKRRATAAASTEDVKASQIRVNDANAARAGAGTKKSDNELYAQSLLAVDPSLKTIEEARVAAKTRVNKEEFLSDYIAKNALISDQPAVDAAAAWVAMQNSLAAIDKLEAEAQNPSSATPTEEPAEKPKPSLWERLFSGDEPSGEEAPATPKPTRTRGQAARQQQTPPPPAPVPAAAPVQTIPDADAVLLVYPNATPEQIATAAGSPEMMARIREQLTTTPTTTPTP